MAGPGQRPGAEKGDKLFSQWGCDRVEGKKYIKSGVIFVVGLKFFMWF